MNMKAILIVKVGNDERPATVENIKELKKKIKKVLRSAGIDIATLVTHHTVDVSIVQFPD